MFVSGHIVRHILAKIVYLFYPAVCAACGNLDLSIGVFLGCQIPSVSKGLTSVHCFFSVHTDLLQLCRECAPCLGLADGLKRSYMGYDSCTVHGANAVVQLKEIRSAISTGRLFVFFRAPFIHHVSSAGDGIRDAFRAREEAVPK